MVYIISIVLKSSSLLLLIGGLLILLQNQTSKLKHFLISWSLLGLLLLPFLIEVLPSLEVEVPYTSIATNEVAINKEKSVASITESELILPSKELFRTNNLTDKGKIQHSNIGLSVDEEQIVKTEKKGITIPTIQILYGIWLFGSLFFLVRFLLGAFIIFRITKASYPYSIPDKLKKRLQGISRQFPQIYCNDSIQTPMTWGVFKPVILLPNDASNWDTDTLQIVLLHEGMHIHRRDYWWHIIGVLALCLYWWHPLVWIIKKRQVLEREKACDEGVLHLGTSQKAYAQTLVAMTKQLALSNKFHLEHTLSMAKKTQIKQRVMAILNFQNSSRRSTILRQSVVAVFLILALPLIARISPVEVANILEETLPILMPIEKLPTVPTKSIPIAPKESNIVIDKNNIKSPIKTFDNSIDESTINTLPPSPITTLPKLAAKLPLVENTPTINIPEKEAAAGLYGEWEEGRSAYKLWTYGDFKTQKNIPFIKTTTADALVIIEETRKTILGKKKFLLTITKAPEDGGVIHSFLNGQPNSLSGGYKKGEPVLLWWEDGEWGGFWSKSKYKWIAKKMGRIMPLLELLEHIDFIKPVSKQDSEWWSVIKEHQRIKKERYFINDPINNVKAVAPTLKFQDIPYKELSVTQRNSNKKVGRTNASKTKSGCSGCSDLLETKYGTVIKTSSQPSLVKTLNIHLADNKFESLEFDMNLYKVKNGEVLYRLTEVPVPFKIGKQENWVSVDLSAHNIPVQGDVLVMLEPKKITGKKRTLFFSLSATHWLYKPISKKNQQNLEDFWDNSFALYFTLK